jgi:LysM repeat protein
MPITHQEARHLIQLKADNTLIPSDKEILNDHLRDCIECTGYANEIQETEAILRTTLRQRWNLHHVPLSISDLSANNFSFRRWLDIVTTRSALIGVTLLLSVFAFVQFSSSPTNSVGQLAVGASAIPTPSLLFTGTQNYFGNCQMINYPVRQDDTLESLARRFMVSKDVITEINHLQPDVARLPDQLLLPACELTPTTRPPTFTNTPSLEAITYTPG